MYYRKHTARYNGDDWTVRELSAGAVECIDEGASEYTQALTMLALSLCDRDGEPRFTPETLADGLAYVRTLPVSLVRDHLIPAATRLNAGDVDDARGN